MLCVLTNNLYKWDKWSSVRAQLKKWRKLNHRGRAAFKRHAWRQRCHGEPDDWSKSHKSYSNLIEFGLDKALIEHFPPPLTLPLNLEEEALSLILMTSDLRCAPCFFYTSVLTLLHQMNLFIDSVHYTTSYWGLRCDLISEDWVSFSHIVERRIWRVLNA